MPRWPTLIGIASLMAVLAATTAAYAWAAGPLLGALYGAAPEPWPAPLGFNLGSPRDPAHPLWIPAGLLAAITAARALARYGHDVLLLRLEQDVLYETRHRLYAHLLALPALTPRGSPRHGDLGHRISVEVERLRALIRQTLGGLGRNGITSLALIGLASSIDAPLTGLALLVVPPLLWALTRLSRRARRAEREAMGAQGKLSGLVTEAAALRPLIRAYDADVAAREAFDRQAREVHRKGLRASRTRSLLAPTLDLLGAAAILTALVLAHQRVTAGALSPRGAISLVAALVLLYRPLQNMASVIQGLSVGLAAVDRVRDILAMPPEPPEPSDAVEAPPLARGITLENVYAGYGGPDVLRGLNLTLRAGESVAVVGMSGAGKSTLLLLLMGLLRPRAGEIRVDGVPLTRVHGAGWRRRIAWVPQEPLIFSDTVMANIGVDTTQPARAKAEAAARRAGAAHFIQALPDGYDTVLEEHGRNLSMGQRQRLCLARALYREPALLLLDEPTASLDGEAERIVSDSIARLIGERTVVLASHRESTVRHMDRVVVLAEGRVVEEGTPAELSARGGVYQAILAGAAPPEAPAPRRAFATEP